MTRFQRATMIALAIGSAIAIGACEKKGSGGAAGSGGAGKERGACYGNGTCDEGLQCLSQLCVRPPPADCVKVAAKLASYRLGNYAPKDERAKVVGELEGECNAAMLSVDEGKCILDAQSRLDVARCPRPLLAELKGDKDGCKALASQITDIFVTDMVEDGKQRARVEKLKPDVAAAFEASCVEDLWPEAAKKCLGMMKTGRDMRDCEDTFDEGAQERIEKRLMPVLEKLMKAMMEEDGGGGGSGGSIPPPPPPPQPPTTQPSGSGSGSGSGASAFETACGGYAKAIESYLACDKAPQAARDAMKQGLDQMRDAMSSQGPLPPEAIKAMADGCAQAEKAMVESFKTQGC